LTPSLENPEPPENQYGFRLESGGWPSKGPVLPSIRTTRRVVRAASRPNPQGLPRQDSPHDHQPPAQVRVVKTRKSASTSLEIALSRFCGPEDLITKITPTDQLLRRNLGLLRAAERVGERPNHRLIETVCRREFGAFGYAS
jgi:hypothetical protein